MTSDGVVIAATDPFEAASIGAIAGSIRSFFGPDWHSGDIALTNDVYNGASHPTEFTAITPLDFGRGYNAIRGWLAVRADFPDVGGWDLGGYTFRALDIWSEGVRITPVKLARQGKIRDEVVQILGLNSRTPRLTDACARAIFQSFQAALSSDCLLAMKSEFKEVSADLLKYGRETAMDWLRELKQGCAIGHADIKLPNNVSAEIHTSVEIAERVLRITFPDAPPSCEQPINIARWLTSDAVARATGAHFELDDYTAIGLAQITEIEIPENSILAVEAVLPVGHGRTTTYRAVEAAVLAALGKLTPRSVGSAPGSSIGVPALDPVTGTISAQEQKALMTIERQLGELK